MGGKDHSKYHGVFTYWIFDQEYFIFFEMLKVLCELKAICGRWEDGITEIWEHGSIRLSESFKSVFSASKTASFCESYGNVLSKPLFSSLKTTDSLKSGYVDRFVSLRVLNPFFPRQKRLRFAKVRATFCRSLFFILKNDGFSKSTQTSVT